MKKYIILFLLIVVGLTSCKNEVKIKDFKKKWDIELPSTLEDVYNYRNIGSFGEGEMYVVYNVGKHKEAINSIFMSFTESNINDEIIAKPQFIKSFNDSIKNVSINKNYLPNLDNNYYWLFKGSEFSTRLYGFYFEDLNYIYMYGVIL